MSSIRLILAGAIVGCILSTSVLSAPGGSSGFSSGFNGNVDALPPGRLKQQIQKLPPAAQQQALEWLERFNIPSADYEFLNADENGALFYTDTVLPDEAGGEAAPESEPQPVAPADTFLLHSRPGASNIVFLDFDGHNITGTAWNSGGASTYYAKPYDTDGDEQTFSDVERNKIAEIWHRVAEDMAPFDIDVTTEDPGSFGPTTGHVLITADTDATGESMPYDNAGGVAYVGVWGASSYTYYQPALVYYSNLGSGYPPYVSEASSHELGHNLGLGHDGTASSSYYSGHGSGYISWAPVMGVGYSMNVTQWSKGEYSGANNQQDDLQIISSKLGYRADDHSDSTASATALQVEPDGIIYVTFPEIDPFNLQTANKGIIETTAETDLFWFDTAAGGVTLNVTPAWEAFYRSSRRGANLDIEAALYDQLGNFVTSSDLQDDTRAQINTSLAAGRYYLAVTGVGNSVSPYSDYGSLGMYFISGSVQPPPSNDFTPPDPNPMGWATTPAAASHTAISMIATTAIDESSSVQYMFQCSAGGSGCNSSGWQASTQYNATGLMPSTGYSYQVKARDMSGNETGWSAISSASTDANQPPQTLDDSATTEEDSSISITVLGNDSDPDGDSLTITSYTQPANGSVSQDSSSLVYSPDSGYYGNDSFSYTISDGFDNASANVAVTVSEVNNPPIAAADSATVAQGDTVTIAVLTNDSDPDGDSLTIDSYTQGNKGSVIQVGSMLEFTSTGKRGGDNFSYTISDGKGGFASTVVNISITRNGGGGGDDGGGGGGKKCNPKHGC
ncbi:Ig-like domain-containing protein [Amphritea sp. HPY]|uniref:Ig-like domain-containing protein n=1 Tax=Amphritea sp. HPY TaxID=3421652 RepID=UPI003D7D3E9D